MQLSNYDSAFLCPLISLIGSGQGYVGYDPRRVPIHISLSNPKDESTCQKPFAYAAEDFRIKPWRSWFSWRQKKLASNGKLTTRHWGIYQDTGRLSEKQTIFRLTVQLAVR